MFTMIHRYAPLDSRTRTIPRLARRENFKANLRYYRLKQLRLYFNYTPIGRKEIRLLRGSRNRDGTLYGELQTFPLNSPDLPPFHTVSYAWGSPSFKNSIEVDGEQLPVLDSLFPFLASAFGGAAENWWWVDSLCINQNDDLEKSRQVPLMGKIFRTAANTFVWLGEKNEDSDKAMAFLDYLGGYFWHLYYSDRHWVGIEELASRSGEYGARWSAIERLFQRAW